VRQLSLQIETTQARHAHVEHEARRAVAAAAAQKVRRGRETFHPQGNGSDQAGEGLADCNVVINDEHDWVRRLHFESTPAKGNVN
jgi:hypothetical protein